MSDMYRRNLLRTLTVAGAAASAGCIGFFTGDAQQGAVLGLDETKTRRTEGSGVNHVYVEDLTGAERDVVREAIETGAYTTCDTDGPVRDVANRLEGELNYLVDGDDRYVFWLEITDVMYATRGEAPDAEPNC